MKKKIKGLIKKKFFGFANFNIGKERSEKVFKPLFIFPKKLWFCLMMISWPKRSFLNPWSIIKSCLRLKIIKGDKKRIIPPKKKKVFLKPSFLQKSKARAKRIMMAWKWKLKLRPTRQPIRKKRNLVVFFWKTLVNRGWRFLFGRRNDYLSRSRGLWCTGV